MNKSNLVQRASSNLKSLSKPDIKEGTDLITDFLLESLKNKYRIEIRHFGTFSTRFRKQHLARDPRNGKAIAVSNKHHAYFRASKTLKKDLNA